MTNDIVSAVQSFRDQLHTELAKPNLNASNSRKLLAATNELDAATARLLSLEINWEWPDLAQRTQQIQDLSKSLPTVTDTTRVLGMATQVVSLVSFVLAHVEPDKPWPRKW